MTKTAFFLCTLVAIISLNAVMATLDIPAPLEGSRIVTAFSEIYWTGVTILTMHWLKVT